MNDIVNRSREIVDYQLIADGKGVDVNAFEMYQIEYNKHKQQTGSYSIYLGTLDYYPMMEKRHDDIVEVMNCDLEHKIAKIKSKCLDHTLEDIKNTRDLMNNAAQHQKVQNRIEGAFSTDDLMQRIEDFENKYDSNEKYIITTNFICLDDGKIVLHYKRGTPQVWSKQDNCEFIPNYREGEHVNPYI